MDKFAPPTDSLYKWIAITAFLLMAFSAYTKYDARKQLTKIVSEYPGNELARSVEYTGPTAKRFPRQAKGIQPPDVYPVEAMPSLPDVEFVVGTVEDRNKYREAVEARLSAIKAKTEHPYSLNVMQEYFKRPEVKNAYAALGKKAAEYDKMVKDMTLQEFTEMTSDERLHYGDVYENLAMHLTTLARLWPSVDDCRSVDLLCNLGILVGGVFTVIGFALWWSRVQQYQDLLLFAEATDALAKLPKPSAAPHDAGRRKGK